MMTDLEACNSAAVMLKAVGFEHRYTSLKSEAAYYGWPGCDEVIRVAGHRFRGQEYGLKEVICCMTFTAE